MQITRTTTVDNRIYNIYLVKHSVPNDEIKYGAMKTIQDKHNAFAVFTKDIWTIKTCSVEETPPFVIVAFQKGIDSWTNDPTSLDNFNFANIRLTMNSKYWDCRTD